jgi:hypothetical protein
MVLRSLDKRPKYHKISALLRCFMLSHCPWPSFLCISTNMKWERKNCQV